MVESGVTAQLSPHLDGRGLALTANVLKSRRLADRLGDLPGALYVHGGIAPTTVSVLAFRPSGVEHRQYVDLAELELLVAEGCPLWVRLKGLADQQLLHRVFACLEVPEPMHQPLIDTPQRTRVDALGGALLVVMHRLSSTSGNRLVSEQVGLVLLGKVLLSVEEVPRPVAFPELTRWLDQLQPPPTAGDIDDILFFLMDEVLDEVLPLLEQLSDGLDELEEASIRRPSPRVLRQAYEMRSTLRQVRGMIWPLRSQLIVLIRQSYRVLDKGAIKGFREVSSHVDVIFETAELLRHQCDGVTASYMASISNRMNQVMKMLTIISSIFVPLTFIAGVYGMNFNPDKSPWNMPELNAYYGYPLCIAFMILIAGIQMFMLWRRGWFQDWTGTR
ncbi:MAG: magnesium and cobalt transport protein CorA [Synechococcaceae bacterium LLD_019]|nr:magnesium and cobalt transport protein CorA [Synechococcaceae bacterium WB6_1A_059]NBQ19308.1 magnesium and cobalt transport protein CorA [Synechococcaceae bacterium WB5_2A_257]NBY60300.1 magnesium and cobalt transport protein CorA [Synechococcaceae bacterium LLD_019]NDG02020.1 magnesium and cobalt transport protein CorA [Synechococcaceae bacterium WBB_34_004]